MFLCTIWQIYMCIKVVFFVISLMCIYRNTLRCLCQNLNCLWMRHRRWGGHIIFLCFSCIYAQVLQDVIVLMYINHLNINHIWQFYFVTCYWAYTKLFLYKLLSTFMVCRVVHIIVYMKYNLLSYYKMDIYQGCSKYL